MNTIEAVIKNGRIVPVQDIQLPDGAKAIVRILEDEETEFRMSASKNSLEKIWDNEEDDVYAELLTK